jgi:hypothetical protein
MYFFDPYLWGICNDRNWFKTSIKITTG